MIKTAAFPARYVQGPGALAQLPAEIARFALSALVLVDQTLPEPLIGAVPEGDTLRAVPVRPACTLAAIAAAAETAQAANADAICAMGGGKVIDLGRAVADQLRLPFVSIPTVAASDAPCSGLSVIYTEEGAVVEDRFVRSNPRLVVVDSAVIAQAPARFLAAGIGDALATFLEADACFRSGNQNMVGGTQSLLAMQAARLCLDTILEHGAEAMRQCRAGSPGPALEAVLEANILLSGIGFESGGVAAAHAIHHGLADLPETHGALHGEKVAFGVMVELVLNAADDDELTRIARFCRTIGLPITLAELGVTASPTTIDRIAARATRSGEIIYNEPVDITPEKVAQAILGADQFGTKINRSAA